MDARSSRACLWDWLFLLGAGAFGLSILWVNLHGAPFYNFDMYSDALVARRMAESGSLFPPDWVFGNQVYVIATPVWAALLYPLCHDSALALGLASCLMTGLILACFVWCCRPFLSGRSIAVGLFCLAGGVLLGDSASSCLYGMQLLYTMGSYYACYVLGLLLHLGLYLRLRTGRRVGALLWAAALLSDLALGMQSVRETLLLNLPLVLLELWLTLRRGKNARALCFALLALGFNLAGLGLMRLYPARSVPIIAPVALNLSPASLWARLRACLGQIGELSGLRYLTQRAKLRPLTVPALFFWAVVIAAPVLALRRRERGPALLLPGFCALSVLAVLGVGVLLFETRAIYYFVWFLLVSFCAAWLTEALPAGRGKALFLTGLLLCGAVSYVYNFYPDFKRAARYEAFYQRLAGELEAEGVDRIYTDLITQPTLAACSGDRIVSGTVYYHVSGEGAPLRGIPQLRDDTLYRDVDPARSRIVLSASDYSELDSLQALRQTTPPDFSEALLDRLELERTETLDAVTYWFYRFSDPELIG